MRTLRYLSFLAGLFLLFYALPLSLPAQNTAPVPADFVIFFGDQSTGLTFRDSTGGYVWARDIRGNAFNAAAYDTTGAGIITANSLLGGRERRWFFEVTDTAAARTVVGTDTLKTFTIRYGEYGRRSYRDTTLAVYVTQNTTWFRDFPFTGLHTFFNTADSVDVKDKFMITVLRKTR